METITVEVWVLVDEDGNYVASDDREHATERYDEVIGEDRNVLALRWVKASLTLPKPKPAEVVATISGEPDAADVKVA